MSSSLSSTNLSILSFALNSWLDGSAQLRRSVILFPLDLGNAPRNDEQSTPTQQQTSLQEGQQHARLSDRFMYQFMRWFAKPEKDLDEFEKAILGVLDLSSSSLLLKLLGSGPVLPFILNPLSITLALPRKISVGSVKWSRVVLACFLLSILHEAQRTSVATGIAWLRQKKAAQNDANVGEIVLRGERIERTEDDESDEEPEPCVICSGGHSDDSLSDSVSSLASISSVSQTQSQSQPTMSDPGPLEAFCVHAPTKHPMHRSCFLAWKDAYWEARTSRPIITLVSDDGTAPVPGTWQWRRALTILVALGSRIWHMTYYIPLAPAELYATADVEGIGDSVFTLRCQEAPEGSSSSTARSDELGSMISVWPPCPGCRSSVKLIFARQRPVRRPGVVKGGERLLAQLLRVWLKSWEQLASGRTILARTTTQVIFAAVLVSMMRMRKSGSRHSLLVNSFRL